MHAFWARLKQRKLVQWALAYLAGAWLLLQVLHLLGETYAWPPALMRAIPVLLGFGFLGTLVVAWHHGERGRQRVSGPELLLLCALLVVAGGAVWLVGAQPAAYGPARAADATGDVPRYAASVAVLPFDNLDGDAASDYFAEGITIEIISELAKVAGLKVISRTSVLALRGSRLTLPRIADTLGVRHVVEGAVRRMGDSARVRASLIDPQTDTQLWAATFDRGVQAHPAERQGRADVHGDALVVAAEQQQRTRLLSARVREVGLERPRDSRVAEGLVIAAGGRQAHRAEIVMAGREWVEQHGRLGFAGRRFEAAGRGERDAVQQVVLGGVGREAQRPLNVAQHRVDRLPRPHPGDGAHRMGLGERGIQGEGPARRARGSARRRRTGPDPPEYAKKPQLPCAWESPAYAGA